MMTVALIVVGCAPRFTAPLSIPTMVTDDRIEGEWNVWFDSVEGDPGRLVLEPSSEDSRVYIARVLELDEYIPEPPDGLSESQLNIYRLGQEVADYRFEVRLHRFGNELIASITLDRERLRQTVAYGDFLVLPLYVFARVQFDESGSQRWTPLNPDWAAANYQGSLARPMHHSRGASESSWTQLPVFIGSSETASALLELACSQPNEAFKLADYGDHELPGRLLIFHPHDETSSAH
ncbi:MAG: hypothetical protein ACTS3F_14860 [Phycisphaerales bacterium]